MNSGGHLILHYMSFESEGVNLFMGSKCQDFGDVGLYAFHHSSQLEAIGNQMGLEKEADVTPNNQIVKGHRVMTLRK